MTTLAASRWQIPLCLGQAEIPVGTLVYVRQGQREHSAIGYAPSWLADPQRFTVSADLELVASYQSHKAASAQDSVFHGALADTAPDAWGRRVIARDHAKRRREDPTLRALTELDYLLAVDDFSRVGALRLRAPDGSFHRTSGEGERSTPPMLALERIFQASHALERGEETAEDLRYLQGKGTSLGGMRPKCTVIDDDGQLAIGKFPSVGDARSVTRGEVLALHLAQRAGLNAAAARVVVVGGVPVAVIRRFDRHANGRIPYQSAASMLQASRDDERSYLEIADVIRARSHAPTRDLQELWCRLVLNLLITNVDDHLQNHGFLHVENGLWRLAPTFDINPFPDKERESKTWLSEQDGPITDVKMLMARRAWFALDERQALDALGRVHAAVSQWRQVALSPAVGMQAAELEDFASAFEHEQLLAASALLK